MILKDISFPSPEYNILYDDVLLKMAEEGHLGETLRFWESERLFVVLGRTGKFSEDVDVEAVERDNIPVLRRFSGGGTVLQGQGCFNYTLILRKNKDPRLADLRKSYRIILEKVAAIVEHCGVAVEIHPISDIAAPNQGGAAKKFSGNAQRRARQYIMHHGTILYDFNLGLIERYLKMPKDIPLYRQGRSHRDFVTNIPVKVSDLKNAFTSFFGIKDAQSILSDAEDQLLHKVSQEKNNFLNVKE